MNEISSPCILVCSIDDKTGLCFGCARSAEEIAGWLNFTPEQRQRITAELDARLKTITRKPRRETRRRRMARLRTNEKSGEKMDENLEEGLQIPGKNGT